MYSCYNTIIMHLVVIRHGETALNRDERLQGSRGPDEPLTANGRAEILRLRDALMIAPRIIYVSPLRRTKETATILNERFNVPVIEVPELMERDFGSLSGAFKKDVKAELLEDDLEGRYDYRPYGGESVQEVTARVLRFLSTLDLSDNGTGIVVTHRGILRILYDLYPNSARPSEIVPASMHHFEVTALPLNTKPA